MGGKRFRMFSVSVCDNSLAFELFFGDGRSTPLLSRNCKPFSSSVVAGTSTCRLFAATCPSGPLNKVASNENITTEEIRLLGRIMCSPSNDFCLSSHDDASFRGPLDDGASFDCGGH